MKYITMVLISMLLFFSCKKWSSLPNDYNTSAKIISEVSGKPIAGATMIVEVLSAQPGIGGYYDEVLDSFSVKSDNNGDLNFNIRYNDDLYIHVRFFCIDTSTTGLVNSKTDFSLEDFKQLAPFTFLVRELEPLNITVKTINHYNNDDAIDVDVVDGNIGYPIGRITSIQNFADKNQGVETGNWIDYNNPYWIGNNVNSIIHEKLEEGTTYKINWGIKKDGAYTDYYSNTFKTQSDTLNAYTILY
jgi:hypothetical protein